MKHNKYSVRKLVHDGWMYPVIHETARRLLDDEACFLCDDNQWAMRDGELISALIREGVIVNSVGVDENE